MRWQLVWLLLGSAACTAGSTKPPLWRDSHFTRAERDGAVLRGLAFIDRLAADERFFRENIGDLLWCFFGMVASSPSPDLRQIAQRYGEALARRWRSRIDRLPPGADIDLVWDLGSTLDVAESLGVRHAKLRYQLEKAIPTFSVEDWLDFDPRREPPPQTTIRLRGREACAARGLQGSTCNEVGVNIVDLDVFYDAMITTYFGDRFGVTHGATFAQFSHWLVQLYPYPDPRDVGADAFYDLIYVVTHIVYTHNHYSQWRLSPSELPEELHFLLDHFHVPLDDHDCETYAEFVDSLRAFGVTPEENRDMARAIESLMHIQNPDGSWGDPALEDPYDRFHTTWTAIEALRDHRFASPGTPVR